MRLGWRNPRPNDFNSPDERPLKDALGDLQRFMTWPHFTAVVDDLQATSTAYSDVTITAVDDPYSLIRATDRIQVPTDFDSWMFKGYLNVPIDSAGNGMYQGGFRLNGTTVSELVDDNYGQPPAHYRVNVSPIYPVQKGDYLTVALRSPAASTVDAAGGFVAGFFLPLV